MNFLVSWKHYDGRHFLFWYWFGHVLCLFVFSLAWNLSLLPRAFWRILLHFHCWVWVHFSQPFWFLSCWVSFCFRSQNLWPTIQNWYSFASSTLVSHLCCTSSSCFWKWACLHYLKVLVWLLFVTPLAHWMIVGVQNWHHNIGLVRIGWKFLNSDDLYAYYTDSGSHSRNEDDMVE